jgi:hypothetical protein
MLSLMINVPESRFTKSSIKVLTERKIYGNEIQTLFKNKTLTNDKSSNVISILNQLKSYEVHESVEQIITDSPSNQLLCDKQNLFDELNNGNAFLKEEDNLPFVKTPESDSSFNTVFYALKSGIPLLIQGPTCSAKSKTGRSGAEHLFQKTIAHSRTL